jgi:hypothetical protein
MPNDSITSETKVCSKCGVKKPLAQFYQRKNNGKYYADCIECNNAAGKIYRRQNPEKVKENNRSYRLEHKEELQEYQKQYRSENKEEIAEYQKEYRLGHKEEKRAYNKQYKEEHKEELNERQNDYLKGRRQTDIIFAIRTAISAAIRYHLKSNGSSKNGQSVLDYLPYTIDRLWSRLESQFEPWMNRMNYGTYNSNTWDDNDPTTWRWQLDHIIPHSTFHYETMDCEEFQECWALSNLRPLSAKQNVIDGASKVRHKPKSTKKTKSDKPKKSKKRDGNG